jgi:hypothetical protein
MWKVLQHYVTYLSYILINFFHSREVISRRIKIFKGRLAKYYQKLAFLSGSRFVRKRDSHNLSYLNTEINKGIHISNKALYPRTYSFNN